MHLSKLLAGMFIAYLLFSPRLRHFIFRRDKKSNVEDKIKEIEEQEKQSTLKTFSIKINGKPAEVSREQLEDLIKKSEQPNIN